MLCFYVCEQKVLEGVSYYDIIQKFESMDEAKRFSKAISNYFPSDAITILDAEEHEYYEYLFKSKILQR
jgi:hypothetical protein